MAEPHMSRVVSFDGQTIVATADNGSGPNHSHRVHHEARITLNGSICVPGDIHPGDWVDMSRDNPVTLVAVSRDWVESPVMNADRDRAENFMAPRVAGDPGFTGAPVAPGGIFLESQLPHPDDRVVDHAMLEPSFQGEIEGIVIESTPDSITISEDGLSPGVLHPVIAHGHLAVQVTLNGLESSMAALLQGDRVILMRRETGDTVAEIIAERGSPSFLGNDINDNDGIRRDDNRNDRLDENPLSDRDVLPREVISPSSPPIDKVSIKGKIISVSKESITISSDGTGAGHLHRLEANVKVTFNGGASSIDALRRGDLVEILGGEPATEIAASS